MVRIPLRKSRVLQKLFPGKAALRVYGGDGKGTPGQRAGFVEDHGLRFGQGFEVVAALDQDTALASPADAPKKLSGTEITSAQGQEMTRKIKARWSQLDQVFQEKGGWDAAGVSARARVGIRNSARAAITTQGV